MIPLKNWSRPTLKPTWLIIATAIFLALADNHSFLKAVFKAADQSAQGEFGFKIAVVFGLIALFTLLLSFFSSKYVLKPFVMFILVLASVISFFMDTYGVILDVSMVQNIFETDTREAVELISFKLVLHVLLWGGLPALMVYRTELSYQPFLKELLTRVLFIVIVSAVLAGTVFSYYKDFSFLDRNNRALRFLINPNYPIYAVGKYLKRRYNPEKIVIQAIGTDAQQVGTWQKRGKKALVVVVVGETARAKNFSLNGYSQNTNPRLSQEDIIFFPDTHSCGTATAESVPCMFSDFGRSDYSDTKAKHYENLLDVLTHAGIGVLWRDNNSGCKGVCGRVPTVAMENLKDPVLCKTDECFDEILLKDLQAYVDKMTADTVIVMHQKGSHGPAYFKRHPDEFKVFTPECTLAQVQDCPKEQIVNAYDNTILYTDYFLSKVIGFLKGNAAQYDTAMLYMSDHGESLGENGIYLHGLPYMLSPDEQKHIPFVLWLSEGYGKDFGVDTACLKRHSGEEYSHDNLFHSVLGMLDIKSAEYDPERDIFNRCRR